MKVLFLILFLLPGLASAFPAVLSWDNNPEEEKVTNYEVFLNGEFLVNSGDNVEEVTLRGGECFSVLAVNDIGKSALSSQVCAPIPPTSPRSISISYTDRNGNPVTIVVPIPE